MTVETPQAHLDHSEIDGFMSTGQNELNEYMWLFSQLLVHVTP